VSFYRTFMVDPLGALKGNLANGIQSQLALLFSPVISNFYEGNWVYFTADQASPMNNELLVYFMPSGQSIVQMLPGLSQTADFTSDGWTAWVGSLVASEVYVSQSDPVLLAKLAFHELMHNRFLQGNSMHSQQDGLGATSIGPSTPLTPTNIRTMAAVIQNPSQQWGAGFLFSAVEKLILSHRTTNRKPKRIP